MTWRKTVLVCVLATWACGAICDSLVLERLPRHIPRREDMQEDDAALEDDTLQASHDIVKKPTFKAAARPISGSMFGKKKRSLSKRDAQDLNEDERHELAAILQGEDQVQEKTDVDKKHLKRKREEAHEDAEKDTKEKDFQEWLRREYYRNLARSLASMRRKRESVVDEDSPSSFVRSRSQERQKKSSPALSGEGGSFSEITDNLRAIEDQLFEDALQTMREMRTGEEGYEDEEGDDAEEGEKRISNDLSLAYDLETMRNAFFRLRETLTTMQAQQQEKQQQLYRPRKRSSECPALEQLTSDCSSLSDILPEGPMKRLLRKACNWHEVCYTCGKSFGLSAEVCDGSFVDQTQTVCRGEEPCESTASLLLVPLRQRRVFFKRSAPDLCRRDPCLRDFLKEGLTAIQVERYNHV